MAGVKVSRQKETSEAVFHFPKWHQGEMMTHIEYKRVWLASELNYSQPERAIKLIQERSQFGADVSSCVLLTFLSSNSRYHTLNCMVCHYDYYDFRQTLWFLEIIFMLYWVQLRTLCKYAIARDIYKISGYCRAFIPFHFQSSNNNMAASTFWHFASTRMQVCSLPLFSCLFSGLRSVANVLCSREWGRVIFRQTSCKSCLHL